MNTAVRMAVIFFLPLANTGTTLAQEQNGSAPVVTAATRGLLSFLSSLVLCLFTFAFL